MNLSVIGIAIFITSVVIIELFKYGINNMRISKRARIRKKLRKYSYVEEKNEYTDILRKRVLSDTPFVDRMLQRIPGVLKIDKLIIQANAPYQVGFVILLCISLGTIGFFTGFLYFRNHIISLFLTLFMGSLPFVHISILKQRRMEKFRQQLPDALDLISRSLKAGHAFTSGMRLAADEFDDPIGPEFSEVLDEINFGVGVPFALKNLVNRVDCAEIRYFTVAVNLQRETGGNLAEIMGTLSYLLRENFKFLGRVKVLSAEGKISAIILSLMPVVVGIYLHISNPKYLDALIYEPVGRIMLGVAVGMLILGIFTMRKMISIKV